MPCHKLEVQLEKEHKAHLKRTTFSFQDVKKNFLSKKNNNTKKNRAKEMRVIFGVSMLPSGANLLIVACRDLIGVLGAIY